MRKMMLLLCVIVTVFLTGCEPDSALSLRLAAEERGRFSLTVQEFCKAFNLKEAEAGITPPVGEMDKSTAGDFDRYLFAFDGHNRIAFDCEKESGTVSAVYLVYKGDNPSESGGTAAGEKLGAFMAIAIHVGGKGKAEEVESILDELGVTTVGSPQDGYFQECRKKDVYYALSVENQTVAFVMAALKAQS